MALTRLQFYEEYIRKVTVSLVATRIDAAMTNSGTEASVLADMKSDLVTALTDQKTNIQSIQSGANSSFNVQIANIDTQIADVQAVT